MSDLDDGFVSQPEIRWVERDGFVRAEHDGPCVFVDHQCSCGLLDVGIVAETDRRRAVAFAEHDIMAGHFPEHGKIPTPGWDTKLRCYCGFEANTRREMEAHLDEETQ